MGIRRAASLAAIMTAALVSAALLPAAASAAPPGSAPEPVAVELATGMVQPLGSVIGPDGALYVADRGAGQVVRVDTTTGATSTYVTGLPVTGPGGVLDVTFIGDVAYLLISVVGPDVGGTDIGGVYRVDDVDDITLIADTATWSIDNPPDADYFVPSGVQYTLVPYDDGFLIADGHHNRVLFAGLDGEISEVAQYGNVVPTGLQLGHGTIYMAEAGPIPHDPSTGAVVAINPKHPVERVVASGYSLIVDVEAASCGLYALSQGDSPGMVEPGTPGLPDSGELLRVNGNGTFTVVVDELDRPTSLSFVGDTAYIVTLGGDVLMVEDVAPDRHGMWGGCGGMGAG
ncbi:MULTISPECIES: ScyD/ScyE family protein [Microbacterium]|uniref:ScyD/ScyE family protein n=1 Tax=Microbacterium TaxID=33882 RepID=UPI000D65794D|nr:MULTISPECIES: ScyD/ScyE family protein [Microbacterium]